MPSPILGAIRDDLTGAVELAGVLAAGGARTSLFTAASAIQAQMPRVDAVVVALRSRVAPPAEALVDVEIAARALGAVLPRVPRGAAHGVPGPSVRR